MFFISFHTFLSSVLRLKQHNFQAHLPSGQKEREKINAAWMAFPYCCHRDREMPYERNHANAALHSRPQASAPPQPLAIRQRHAGTDYGLALQWILTVVGPMELQILTAAVTDCQHSRALTCARSILCAPLLLRVRGPAETVQLWNGHGDYGQPDADVERKNGRWCSTSAGTSIKNDQRVELWHLPPAAALWRSVWPPPRGGGPPGFTDRCGGSARML